MSSSRIPSRRAYSTVIQAPAATTTSSVAMYGMAVAPPSHTMAVADASPSHSTDWRPTAQASFQTSRCRSSS